MTIELDNLMRLANDALKESTAAERRHKEASAGLARLEVDWQEKYDAALLASTLKSKELREAEARTAARDLYRPFIEAKRQAQEAGQAMHLWGKIHENIKALAYGHHAEVKAELAA